jgi:hypothetical protein
MLGTRHNTEIESREFYLLGCYVIGTNYEMAVFVSVPSYCATMLGLAGKLGLSLFPQASLDLRPSRETAFLDFAPQWILY